MATVLWGLSGPNLGAATRGVPAFVYNRIGVSLQPLQTEIPFPVPTLPLPLLLQHRALAFKMRRPGPKSLTPQTTPNQLVISGVTKDSTGAALAGVTVKLYRTSDDALMATTTSDGSGNYSFANVGLGEAYYVTAYKAGSPDVAGTTVNTLVGA